MAIDLNMPLCFIDCETTGLDPEKDQIVELAAWRLYPSKRTRDLASLGMHVYVQPTMPPSDEVVAINGYNRIEWLERGALKIGDALEKFLPVLEGCIPAGQNVDFDMAFLRSAHKKATSIDEHRRRRTIAWPKHDYHKMDLAVLAWPLAVAGLVEGVSLKHLRKFFGLPGEQAHTAQQDVMDEVHVYHALMKFYSSADGLKGKL